MDPELWTVKIVLPAQHRFIAVARLAAMALISRDDIDYEDVLDTAIALDELCSELLHAVPRAGELELTYELSLHTLAIHGRVETSGDHAEPDVESELRRRILKAATDAYRLERRDGGLGFVMRKSLSPRRSSGP